MEAEIQQPLNRKFPASSKEVQLHWRQEEHLVTKNSSNIPIDRQLPDGDWSISGLVVVSGLEVISGLVVVSVR